MAFKQLLHTFSWVSDLKPMSNFRFKRIERPRGGRNSISSFPSKRTNDQAVRGFVMRFCL